MANSWIFRKSAMLIILAVLIGLFIKNAAGNTRPLRQSYACEGATLNIKCDNPGEEPGQRIRIVRANYGRFSVSVCNPDGVSSWSTKCTSHTSVPVLTEKCSKKPSCSVEVADRTFGDDPCPDTFKYLEVHYECTSENTATPRPTETLQPALPTRPAAAAFYSVVFTITTPSSTTMATSPPTQPTSTTPTSPPTTSTTQPTTSDLIAEPPTTAPVEPLIDTGSITGRPNWRTRMQDSPQSNNAPSYNLPGQFVQQPSDSVQSPAATESCPSVMRLGIRWPITPKGATAFQKCLQNSEAFAEWTCEDTNPPRWKGFPDIRQCTSSWMDDIRRKAGGDVQPEKLAEELARQTSRNALKSGGDMSSAVDLINKIVVRGQRALARMVADDTQDIGVQKLGEQVLKAGSNLLDVRHNASWVELSEENRAETATTLIVSLETTAFMLAENVPVGSILTSFDNNIVMGVGKFHTKQMERNYKLPPKNNDTMGVYTADSIEFTAAALQDHTQENMVKLVFLSYNNVGQYLEAVGTTSTGNVPAGMVVNSKVISAAINGVHRATQLKEPVIITLEHTVPANGQPTMCAFWDYKNDKEMNFQGAWSTRGCVVVKSYSHKTVCECDHLTNFAVLMDVTGTIGTSPHNDALTKITIIGCSISIVCLLVTLIIFWSFRSLQSERTTIHKNLAFCLMMAEIMFISGINQTQLPVGCHIFSALMHYFFLATFAWSLFEGLNLWWMLVEVFDSEKSRRVYYYLAGYGVPLLIVAVCLAVDWRSYATPDYCWLRADNYFILSFVIPVGLIIVLNVMFLSMAMYFMCQNHGRQTALRARDPSSWMHIKTWISGAIGLTFLMSITWVFGFLYVGNLETIIFAYIFTFLNSVQGLFIFVLVCLRNDKVKIALRQFISNQSERFASSICTRSTSSFSDNNPSTGQGFYQCSPPLDKEQPYMHNYAPYYGPRYDTSRRNTVTSTLPPHSPAPVLQCTCEHPECPEQSSTRSSNRDSGHESVSCPSAESPPMQPIHIHQRTLYPPSVARKQASQVLQAEYPAVAARVAARNARHLYGRHCLDPNEHIYAEIDAQQLEEEMCPYSESDESNTSIYQQGGSDMSTDEEHSRRMPWVCEADGHRKVPSYRPSLSSTGTSEHKPLINFMGRMPVDGKHSLGCRSCCSTNSHRIRHTAPRQPVMLIPDNQAYVNSAAMPNVHGHLPLEMPAVGMPGTMNIPLQQGNYNAFGLTSFCDGSKMVRRLPLMPKPPEQPLSYSEC
ncbi:adhesion G protein-coupled receptor L3-like [Paramacrobiotus metropolitanus]|uniref:adhesion G protein-coupled receptor L3-like n=1 Tax=Paramacrobiotus metropolitanus TaxID=2943436 RepID=UPI0024462EDF|nr:adhesion G protein-coupled receptor L3-like [Paramacrobiotus metropolitanus]XP_055333205.1 adhesion G protein-coupled receptor L3-like [Paramacrobiotus metropolitanus]XP_055333207.1 adhesion G protein-coupled receptor L3-like [Paramacrobiotus metropolitanus]XP_055333208.1 adhesion G protein-coupled receptor L3-like [Paramacrobiotus metropolitanus]XP_055333209.1 adhesion G protein-coupled receptor L3-like [Paramacrobiotus metropolitanus]